MGPTRAADPGARFFFLQGVFEEERFPPRRRAVPLRLRERAQQRGSDGDGGHAGELLRFRDGEQAGGFHPRLGRVALVVSLGLEAEDEVGAAVVVSAVLRVSKK